MSYILRTSLKYSLIRLSISTLKNGNGPTSGRMLPCLNHFMYNYAHANAAKKIAVSDSNKYERGSHSVDKCIKRIDLDVKRLGRISLKNVEEVLTMMVTKGVATENQSLMIIRCCGNLLVEEPPEKRNEFVRKIWKTLENLGVKMDIGHYNALLRVYLENECNFAPTDMLADLEKRGLQPNRVTYQRLVMKYCQLGDVGGATHILEFMREKEIPINVQIFNALILGHSQSKDMESAEKMLSVMNQAGIEPNSESYTHLICGFLKQKNMDKVNALLKDYEFRDIAFTDVDNFDIVYTMAMNGFEEEVDSFLSRIRRGVSYNQEAMNVIYRLISAKKFESAFKVLKSMVRSTRVDGSYMPLGNFFIVHLIRCNAPPETVLKYCQALMQDNYNPQALSVAMENSLRLHNEKTALTLFKAAKDNGIPLRPHYFWPLLVNHGKKQNREGLFNILYIMNKDFGLSANTETIREYVIPYLLKPELNLDSFLLDIKACGCSVANAVSGLVINWLNKKNIKNAAEVAQKYKAFYAPFLIRRPLVASYLETRDLQSFITLLKEIGMGIHWRANIDSEKDDEEIVIPEHREVIGQIVVDVVKSLKAEPNCTTELEKILKKMLEEGLGIGVNAAKEMQDMLQDQLSSNISALLEKLTSDEFAVPAAAPKGSRLMVSSLDEKSLERLCEKMTANNESTRTIKKQLFSVYGRKKDLDKLLKVKEELEADGFIFTNGMYAYLIDTYVEHNKLDEALEVYNKVCETTPNFSLNTTKQLRLALLMVQNDKIDEAKEFLKKKPQMEHERDNLEDGSFTCGSLCWRILNTLAEKGDVEKVNEFFDLMLSNELTEVTNILLGPLIKVHLKSDDVEGAMKAFEKYCLKYRFTPWKSELARTFIEKEDAVNLQKLTDLSTQIHGEMNSLYDLMLSFLECGRIRQAKKILETPGLRFRMDRLQTACNKYQNEGATEHLKNLIQMTKGVNSVNRSELFFNLLNTYDATDDYAEALALWEQMQEEDVPTTDSFLILLAKILNRHEISVPFSIPNESEVAGTLQKFDGKLRASQLSLNLRKCIKSGNIDNALELKQKSKPEQLNRNDWSVLIQACLKSNRYKEAVKLFNEYRSYSGQLPHQPVVKNLLKSAMKFGDMEFVDNCDSLFSKELKRDLSYDNIKCRTYLNAGKAAEYLKELEEKLDNIKNSDELKAYIESFPRGALVNVMKVTPENFSHVERILDKLSKNDSNNAVVAHNIKWVYYMSEKDFDKAQTIWDNHLRHSDNQIAFQSLTFQIRRNGDTELGKRLVDMLREKSNINSRALGIAYGCAIAALVNNNAIDAALKLLDNALQKISINDIFISSLRMLKTVCEAKNIGFPYTLPSGPTLNQKSTNEGSGSDSD